MKTIVILNFVILFSFMTFGQLRDTTIQIDKNKKVIFEYDIKWNKNELKQKIDQVKEDSNLPMLKSSTGINGILPNIPLSTDGCINGGFENTYTGWTGLALKHSSSTTPIENGLSLNTGIVALPLTGTGYGGDYTQIQVSGNDPVLSAAIPSFLMQKVKAGSNSLRLGNDTTGWGSEGVAKRFKVTSANSKYYFQYAVVMDKSHSNSNGTANGSEVFFIAEAVTMNGTSIDKIVEIGNPSNPFVGAVKSTWGIQPGVNVYYRNWRCAYLDLSGYIGQEVVVMFINSDCSAGGHKGYTYLDAVCQSCVNVNEGDVSINLAADTCMKFPQTINGTFTLPASGNAVNSSIKLQIYQNNALVGTINNPTITGTNYSFTLNASDFPNQSPGSCYDLVSVLTFQIPDMNGNLQTVTQLSSNVVGGVQDGEKPGLNNDVCICVDNTPPTCCDIPGINYILWEKDGKYELKINSGSTAIQEIEVTMMDYHVEYSQPDCKPANMGNFGILSSTSPTVGTLVFDASTNNSQSLVWRPGTPTVLNDQPIKIDVTKPSVLNIKCCEVKFNFCLKVTIKDINCNVCEVIVCPVKDWAVLNQNKILTGNDDPINTSLNEGRTQLNDKGFGKDVEEWYAQLNQKPWMGDLIKKYPDDIKSLVKLGRRLIQEKGTLEKSDISIIEKTIRLLDREVTSAPRGFVDEAMKRFRNAIGKNWSGVMEELKR